MALIAFLGSVVLIFLNVEWDVRCAGWYSCAIGLVGCEVCWLFHGLGENKKPENERSFVL